MMTTRMFQLCSIDFVPKEPLCVYLSVINQLQYKLDLKLKRLIITQVLKIKKSCLCLVCDICFSKYFSQLNGEFKVKIGGQIKNDRNSDVVNFVHDS